MENKIPDIDVVFDAETIAERIEILAAEIAKNLPENLKK